MVGQVGPAAEEGHDQEDGRQRQPAGGGQRKPAEHLFRYRGLYRHRHLGGPGVRGGHVQCGCMFPSAHGQHLGVYGHLHPLLLPGLATETVRRHLFYPSFSAEHPGVEVTAAAVGHGEALGCRPLPPVD